MKIVYCTWLDPYDKRTWSGTQLNIMESLKKNCGDVITVGPIKNKYIFWGKVINKIMQLLFKKNFTYKATLIVSKEFAKVLNKKLKKIEADVLFFPGGSELLAFLETDIPVVYLTDATYELMVGYYQGFSNVLDISKDMGNIIEGNAINKASMVILASNWVEKSVINHYKCDPDKAYVIPFGSNLEVIPDREEILNLRKKKFLVCKMLLVGVNWERKGCRIAFDTMCLLNERGINTELILVGCVPPKGIKHDKLRITGYLDKNNPDDLSKIAQLYKEATIFILPTRSECAGIVFCEASSFGLPIISSDTGGVSTYINSNTIENNGFLLSLESSADRYADVVESLIADENQYYNFAVASRDKFEKDLNWDAWGQQASKLLKNLIH